MPWHWGAHNVQTDSLVGWEGHNHFPPSTSGTRHLRHLHKFLATPVTETYFYIFVANNVIIVKTAAESIVYVSIVVVWHRFVCFLAPENVFPDVRKEKSAPQIGDRFMATVSGPCVTGLREMMTY